jgi:hypothetical protein
LADRVSLSPSDGFGASFNEVGGEAQLRFPAGGHWSFGVGFQYTTGISQGQRFTTSGEFLEPRLTFEAGRTWLTPYLVARFALLHGMDSFEGESISLTGQTLSAGVGARLPVSKRIQADVNASLAHNWMGTGGFSSQGYMLRAGLFIALGRS